MLSVYKHIFKQSDEIEDVKLQKKKKLSWKHAFISSPNSSEITLKELKKMQLQNRKEETSAKAYQVCKEGN